MEVVKQIFQLTARIQLRFEPIRRPRNSEGLAASSLSSDNIQFGLSCMLSSNCFLHGPYPNMWATKHNSGREDLMPSAGQHSHTDGTKSWQDLRKLENE